MRDIYEQCAGKWARILEDIGVDEKYLTGKHSECPCCDAGKDTYRWDKNKELMYCGYCGAKNGMGFAMAYLGMNFKETAAHIRHTFLGIETMDTTQKTKEQLKEEQNRALNAKFLTDISSASLKLSGDDPVTKYLNNRGITSIPATIRLLPEYKQDGVGYPCLITRLDDANGNRVSYKIIHLTADGQKANVPVVKKTLPCERDMRGASVKLFKHTGTLAVCEGIETALAHYQDTKIPTWSTDNAGNLAAFDCPADVKNLIIIPDIDSNFVGQSAAYSLAKKASALIGKDGYQLESVSVNLILKFQADYEVLPDHGVKCDYLEYVQSSNQQPLI